MSLNALAGIGWFGLNSLYFNDVKSPVVLMPSRALGGLDIENDEAGLIGSNVS